MDMQTLVNIEGQENQVSLADLAGINIDEVEEKEFKTFAQGNFDWEVQANSDFDTFDKEDDDTGENITVPVITVTCKCIHVHAITDKNEDPNSWMGEEHTERFQVKDLSDIGRFKALMTNSGFTETIRGQGMSLQQCMEKFHGWRFNAKVSHTKSKKDASKVYANLRDVKPIAAQG